MYPILRFFLFKFNAEKAHHLTFSLLKIAANIPFMPTLLAWIYTPKAVNKEVFGLKFRNIVGLAPGMDKNAELIDMWHALGFGYVEIGTVTPLPQAGNDKPRMFRLIEDKGIINRMGFNNAGVEEVVKNLKRKKSNIIVGGNIGKNKLTPNELAYKDYELCFEALYPYVDYFVVNVSSPNTPGLRELQEKEPLTKIINHIQAINATKAVAKPILLKIAPDLTHTQLDDIVEVAHNTGLSGLIATNTTIGREGLASKNANEMGGLSGKPLQGISSEIVKYLRNKTNIPIIGVGGIIDKPSADAHLQAGADLVQIYSGLVYKGPALIGEVIG